jgi:hypothetical protein
MSKRIEQKDIFIKSFKNLKYLYDYDFIEEDQLSKIINQIAELLYEGEIKSQNNHSKQIYMNDKIKRQLRREKDQALNMIMLHRGSFL